MVKSPHERLDPRHTGVNDRNFDKLTFNLLVAGELEIIDNPEIRTEERMARIKIAKTICYHKAYLKDEELRDGYDQILKTVEQGRNTWNDNLGDRLHEFYDYQANKIMRERMQQEGQQKETQLKNSNPIAKLEKQSMESEKVIYCAAYNRGVCTFNDHHEGRFSNKLVTKWHICSRCAKAGEKKSHREDQCNSRA